MKSKTYEEFVEKFKPKLTTDDCYTPPEIYEVVKSWAVKEYKLEGREIVRPFYPGGDYEHFTYNDNTVVIDNPPFSILSRIIDFYLKRNIPFFLFAPHLTLFSGNRDICYLITGAKIIYENGANVSTSFITNMDEYKIKVVPDLLEKINVAQKMKHSTPPEKYSYPKNVITSTKLERAARRGKTFKLKTDECYFVRRIDAQKEIKKAIFGAGFLIPDNRANELEKIIGERDDEGARVFKLSKREHQIIKEMKQEK